MSIPWPISFPSAAAVTATTVLVDEIDLQRDEVEALCEVAHNRWRHRRDPRRRRHAARAIERACRPAPRRLAGALLTLVITLAAATGNAQEVGGGGGLPTWMGSGPPIPRITGGTARCFIGNRFCVCGWFYSRAASQGVMLDGQPLGPPVQASDYVLWFDLPEAIGPGVHTITGDPAAGFSEESAEIEVLELLGSIDQDVLFKEQQTDLRLTVRGTPERLPIRLWNTTPEIVRLAGGTSQVLTTSGGPSNTVSETVHAVSPGDFAINYEMATDPCPCADETPVAWEVNQDPFKITVGYAFETTFDLPLEGLGGVPEIPENTPTRTPPRDPGDVPAPEEEPDPTTTDEICETDEVEGRFAPTQGVWQDDPTFEDRTGKQIVRVYDWLYRAELPMIRNRESAILGVIRPAGEPIEVRRDEIWMRGKTSGTRPVPVRFRFTKAQLGVAEELYTSGVVGSPPIGPPCTETQRSFELVLRESRGIPPTRTFTFDESGSYVLEVEAVREDGSTTGLKVGVVGQIMETRPFTVGFVPVVLTGIEAGERKILDRDVRLLAKESAQRITDWFPLVNDIRGIPIVVEPTRDLSSIRERLAEDPAFQEFAERQQLGEQGDARRDALRDEIVRQAQTGGLLAGTDRVIVVLRQGDADLLQGTSNWWGIAVAPKVAFVAWSSSNSRREHTEVVAHELIHTLPYEGWNLWMQAECGLDYHNERLNTAHGHALTERGMATRERFDSHQAIMSGGVESGARTYIEWIAQCTYRHLIDQLSAGPLDPPVLLVQGYISRRGGTYDGVLLPFYQFDSFVDLEEGGRGDWAIVLYGEDGAVIGRFPFEPVWAIPHTETERDMLSFSYRLPDVDGIHRVELVGPDGSLHSRTYSPRAPTVEILEPDSGGATLDAENHVRVEWSASDPDRDPVLATVQYSPDGGVSWWTTGFERRIDSLDVEIDPEADEHRVRVLVTDGTRSAVAERSFSLQP